MADPEGADWCLEPWHGDLDAAAELARAAAAADEHWPLSEQAWLDLRSGRAPRSIQVRDGSGEVIGLAVVEGQRHGDTTVDLSDRVAGHVVLHIVVHPAHRREGIGRDLLRSVSGEADAQYGALVWAHGSIPEATAFAAALGLPEERRLLTLHLGSAALNYLGTTPLPTPSAGLRLRRFETEGADRAALADLNRRAFAEHPDQGQLTEADIADRIAGPWFDPEGLLLAEQDGRLVGFHWTKVVPGAGAVSSDERAPERRRTGVTGVTGVTGEVYVLGVDPRVQGQGVGRMLLRAGLDHLAAREVDEVILYAGAEDRVAVELYRSVGFTTRGEDVAYRLPPQTAQLGRRYGTMTR